MKKYQKQWKKRERENKAWKEENKLHYFYNSRKRMKVEQ